MEESHPYLAAAIMEVVENQIENNDPPETLETLNRLMAQGMSREDAKLSFLGGCPLRLELEPPPVKAI